MGVTFNDSEKKFVFDFEHDGAEDIVSLTGDGYQVEAFGKCFYYWCESFSVPKEAADIRYNIMFIAVRNLCKSSGYNPCIRRCGYIHKFCIRRND